MRLRNLPPECNRVGVRQLFHCLFWADKVAEVCVCCCLSRQCALFLVRSLCIQNALCTAAHWTSQTSVAFQVRRVNRPYRQGRAPSVWATLPGAHPPRATLAGAHSLRATLAGERS